jgi:hypothetical protein
MTAVWPETVCNVVNELAVGENRVHIAVKVDSSPIALLGAIVLKQTATDTQPARPITS